MRILGPALALAVAVSAPAHAQHSLKRLTLRQDLLGWEGVGRLDLDGRGYCTGVLVADDTVLTAGHCLYDKETGAWRGPEGIRFRAGLSDGAAIAERAAVQAVVDSDYDPHDPDGVARLSTDLALVRLEAPIPAATARPFATDPPGEGREVSVVSYGAGRDEALSRQRRCNVLERVRGVMVLDCDGVPGSSGAPVFRIDGTRIRIVSIIAAGHDDGEDHIVFGPEVDARIGALSRALRTGRGMWDERPVAARRVGPDGERSGIGARFVKP